jgi:hypothetical protein
MNKLATGLMSVLLLGGAMSLASTAPASAGEICVLGICITLPGGPGGDHGAPGPIAAAGAPLLILGYGAYWLIKRRRGGE